MSDISDHLPDPADALFDADRTDPAVNYPALVDAYSVVTELHAKAGKEEGLRAASIAVVNAVRRNPANLVYLCQEAWQTPGHFIFYELWPTQAAFEAHNAMPEVQAFYLELPRLAREQPDPAKLRVIA